MASRISTADSIFGGYDVRGVYGADFSEREAQELGRAYGTFLYRTTKLERKRQPKLVLGRDNRLSSPSLHDSFVKGVASTGCNVIDIGIVPTPVVYFACHALQTDGAAVITASHNPPKYNGVKMLLGTRPLSSRELVQVKNIFLSNDFEEKPSFSHGKVYKKSMVEEYVRFVSSKISRLDGMKVVVDGGNGIVGEVGVRLFKKLGAVVIPLYCDLDGSYPNHLPDPSKPENTRDLQARVVRESANLGVAYDGDGDRSVFVDELGRVVKSDDANVLFIRDVFSGKPGARGRKVGFELRCSLVVREEITRLGGIPVETKAGRISVRESMSDGAVFACETTGHVCFAENNGFDDGVYSSARFAEIVRAKNQRVSELTSTVKRYSATKELRIPCVKKTQAVEAIISNLKKSGGKKLKLLLIDGVKYSDERGWGLVRASNTEHLLSARFEGKTKEDLQRFYSLFAGAFPKFVKLPPLEQAMQ